MPDYDAVVIGAGNGGLTAAVSLAQAGRKVLLLERHNVPGGCATSFIRGRFEFEVALHQLSGMGVEGGLPGPLRMLLSQLGVLDKIEWVVMPHLYRLAIPGELDIVLPADRQGAQEVLRAKFPAEAEGIDRFFDLVWDFCMQMV
jgi:prolycopene isomerase